MVSMSPNRIRSFCLRIGSALIFTQAAQPLRTFAQAQQAVLSDPKELEAFIDPLFAERLERLHVPGWARSSLFR